MIGREIKHKLIQELEKSGNVYLSCMKVGVDKATFYRWRENDNKYKELADKAVDRGRENNCDVAEHALMINVKEKKMDAIKYQLSHNSPRYKPKRDSYALIEHKKPLAIELPKEKSYSVLLWEEARRRHEKNELLEREFLGRTLPLKPNGETILVNDLWKYEQYIRDWLKHQDSLRKKLTTDSPEAHPASS